MRTRLSRTCHTVVFDICNSRLPFRRDFLALRLKVASTCRTASSHTRTATAPLLADASLVFTVVRPPRYRCSRRWIRTKPFSEGPLNTGGWICFRVHNYARALLYGRRHFRKLRSLAVKLGYMEITANFEISENLTNRYGYMRVCFVVSSYFIDEIVSVIYGHSVLFIYTALYYVILHCHL
jgi:hypothetical protein